MQIRGGTRLMVKDSRELKIGAAAKKNKNGRTLTNFKTKIGAENNRKICKNMRQQMDPLDQEQ